MSLRAALAIVAFAALAFYADRAFLEGAAVVFLGQTLLRILEWLAFWR